MIYIFKNDATLYKPQSQLYRSVSPK